MMNYEEFEAAVQQLLHGNQKWMHVLPSVPAEHRRRFIQVVRSGIDVPLAFDLVLITREMNDAEFQCRWQSLKPE